MKRKIVTIDESKCSGCGQCIPNCAEGAIQMIDGKARLLGDLFCDGLGACLGHCPEGAITIAEREAEPYDERRVMESVVRQGAHTIKAHLLHLRDHGQADYVREALSFLAERGIANPLAADPTGEERQDSLSAKRVCPGSAQRVFEAVNAEGPDVSGRRLSRLAHWPVQFHLASPGAPVFRGADVLLAADCVAYALGDFHEEWLNGKALLIACPKLDVKQESYLEKLVALIDEARINTLTVMIMEVPCCSGLLALAKRAAARAGRKVPVKCVVVGVQGDVLSEEWV